MTDRLESNSLPAKADAIRDLIAESDAAALTAIERALSAGRLLVDAKAECRHGEWLPFLKRAGVKERRARQYMQLAASGLKSATVADLGGIRAALEFLAKRTKGQIDLDHAIGLLASGGAGGLAALERALVAIDDAMFMMPEEHQEAMGRADGDAERIVRRIADILVGEDTLAE